MVFVNSLNTIIGNKILSQIIVFFAVLAILFGILKFFKMLYDKKLDDNINSPYLLKGNKNAKNSFVVSQNPEDEGSVTLYRSDNENNGIEFSYTCWFLIDGYSYKHGQWKHMFHKGNSSAYPNSAPGVWLHPNENVLRIYMNTFDNIYEHADIENIPIKKWVHLSIVVNQKYMDIYINGFLRKRKKMKSLIKQNFGDVWVNMFGGFEGYISKLRYYRYAIDFNSIDEIVREGPSSDSCTDTGENPPYLDDNWWYDY